MENKMCNRNSYRLAISSLLSMTALFSFISLAKPQHHYYYDAELCQKVENLPAARLIEVEEIFATLLEASGKKGNFILCPIVKQDGAFAASAPTMEGNVIFQGEFIGYNSYFMRSLRKDLGYWGETAVIAHELGHHLLGHTLVSMDSNPTMELEADYFAGKLMQKVGSSLNDTLFLASQPFMQDGGNTHPSGQQRIDAYNAGWLDGCLEHPTHQCPQQITINHQTINIPVDDPNYKETDGFFSLLSRAKQFTGKQVSADYCQQYVNLSILQTKRNQQQDCGHLIDSYEETRWSLQKEGQFNWCMRYSIRASLQEAVIREKQLQQCIKQLR